MGIDRHNTINEAFTLRLESFTFKRKTMSVIDAVQTDIVEAFSFKLATFSVTLEVR
jgi:hypothetical protein